MPFRGRRSMLTSASPTVIPVSVMGVPTTDGSSVLTAASREPTRRSWASGGGGGSVVVLVVVEVEVGAAIVVVATTVVVVVVVGHAPSRGMQRSTRRSVSRAGLPSTTAVAVITFLPGFVRVLPLSAT